MGSKPIEAVAATTGSVNRRGLLQSGIAAAAVGIAAVPAIATDSTKGKLNIGVIGVGNRGASNLAEVKSENIVALCDVDQSYLQVMSSRFPNAKTYADFRQLLEQPDLDAVVISTPDHTHFHATKQAIERGLHVYCEKPLAHSISEVREVAVLAKQKRVVTQTGTQHHASDGYRRVVEIIRSEALGEVKEVHAWTSRPIWPQGFGRPVESQPIPEHLDWEAWIGPAPMRPYHDTYHPRGWRGWIDFGCGALGDMGPHLLDPVVWALELKRPTRIVAESSELNGDSFPASSRVTFEFAMRARAEPLTVVWYDGDRQPPAELTGIQRLPSHGVMFMAERAKLFAPQYGGMPTVLPNDRDDMIELPKPYFPLSPGHHREWINAAKTGGSTSCDFSYGAMLTEICLLGNTAILAETTVECDGEEIRLANGESPSKYLRRAYRDGWS